MKRDFERDLDLLWIRIREEDARKPGGAMCGMKVGGICHGGEEGEMGASSAAKTQKAEETENLRPIGSGPWRFIVG